MPGLVPRLVLLAGILAVTAARWLKPGETARGQARAVLLAAVPARAGADAAPARLMRLEPGWAVRRSR